MIQNEKKAENLFERVQEDRFDNTDLFGTSFDNVDRRTEYGSENIFYNVETDNLTSGTSGDVPDDGSVYNSKAVSDNSSKTDSESIPEDSSETDSKTVADEASDETFHDHKSDLESEIIFNDESEHESKTTSDDENVDSEVQAHNADFPFGDLTVQANGENDVMQSFDDTPESKDDSINVNFVDDGVNKDVNEFEEELMDDDVIDSLSYQISIIGNIQFQHLNKSNNQSINQKQDGYPL